jgi:Fe-S-cluster containining protein
LRWNNSGTGDSPVIWLQWNNTGESPVPPMTLPVLNSTAPWYSQGLAFTCTQCGNCCTGPPGYVHLTREELARLAEHLKLSIEETFTRYCRRVGTRISLKEKRGPGGYDCIFLQEIPADRDSAGDGRIIHARRICSIYPVRPLQCRTWPFWPGNLSSAEAWELAAQRCPGMGQGKRLSAQKIEAIRDARDWEDLEETK